MSPLFENNHSSDRCFKIKKWHTCSEVVLISKFCPKDKDKINSQKEPWENRMTYHLSSISRLK